MASVWLTVSVAVAGATEMLLTLPAAAGVVVVVVVVVRVVVVGPATVTLSPHAAAKNAATTMAEERRTFMLPPGSENTLRTNLAKEDTWRAGQHPLCTRGCVPARSAIIPSHAGTAGAPE